MNIKAKRKSKKSLSQSEILKLVAKNHPSKQQVKKASHQIMAQYKTAIKKLADR